MLGRSRTAIIFHEILPNALSPIIVLGSLMVASAVLLESALSFLGLGDPNLMSWGFMIGAGRSVIRLAWWMSVFHRPWMCRCKPRSSRCWKTYGCASG